MPYTGIPPGKWQYRTRRLVRSHPLDMKELVEIVLDSWNSIFDSAIGPKGFKIGRDIFPKPQIMAFFLHELIPLELAFRYPELWRAERDGTDKDLVYLPNEKFSVEIKTSSHATQIFGNRSYAQTGISARKAKAGYYLAINFEKCEPKKPRPRVIRIRFGWLDHSDWIGQTAATGQQAHVRPESERYKLLRLFSVE